MSIIINGKEIEARFLTNFRAYVYGLELCGIAVGEQEKKYTPS